MGPFSNSILSPPPWACSVTIVKPGSWLNEEEKNLNQTLGNREGDFLISSRQKKRKKGRKRQDWEGGGGEECSEDEGYEEVQGKGGSLESKEREFLKCQ